MRPCHAVSPHKDGKGGSPANSSFSFFAHTSSAEVPALLSARSNWTNQRVRRFAGEPCGPVGRRDHTRAARRPRRGLELAGLMYLIDAISDAAGADADRRVA